MYTPGLRISPVESGEELAQAIKECQAPPVDEKHLPMWIRSVEKGGYNGIFNTIFTAKYDGIALGMVALRPTGPGEKEVAEMVAAESWEGQIPAINALHIHPKHREEGLGTALMAVTHSTIVLSPELADRPVLWVRKNNRPAQRLFKKLGYQVLGETILDIPDENWEPIKAPVLILTKDLKNKGVE
jgi:ribosomal protein S18 acetylase RimI-like enzyme